MPRGGGNRLPDSLKAARGTLRPCRTNPRAPKAEAGVPPRPPRHLPDAERAVWRELARQVGPEGVGTYSPAFFSAFRLTVRTLALVDAAGPDTPPTALSRLVQAASGMLGRLGLDPASVGRVSRPPKTKAWSPMDEFSVDRNPGSRAFDPLDD